MAKAPAIHAAQREYLRMARFEVMIVLKRKLTIIKVAAKPGKFSRKAGPAAGHRRINIIAGIGDMLQNKAAREAEIILPPRLIGLRVAV